MKRLIFGSTIAALICLPTSLLLLYSVAGYFPFPRLLPQQLSWQSWQRSLSSGSIMMEAWSQSLILATATATIALVLCLPVARWLTAPHSRWLRLRSWLERLLIMPILVPGFIAAMGLQLSVLQLDLDQGRFAALVVLHLIPTSPYMLKALTVGYQQMGTRLPQVAACLGARPLLVWWQVELPGLRPAILVGLFFVFMGSIGEYLITFLVGDGELVTLPLVLYPYITAGNRAMASVASIMAMLTPMVFLGVIHLVTLRGKNARS